MKYSTEQSSLESSKKRRSGFAPIRRGLREHLRTMSSNSVKLYLWLQLSAGWHGSERGWVEASCEDMARALGWSTKTLQRTIKELAAKPYIKIDLAANQYELTRIGILKFDLEDPSCAMDKYVQSEVLAVDCAVDAGMDKSVRSTVHSKPPISQIHQDLHAPKKSEEVKKEKKGGDDAVRRRFDAELPSPTKGFFSPSEKNKKLKTHLAAKIRHANDSFLSYIEMCAEKGWEHPFGKDEQEAFNALQYQPDLKSPLLSWEFVYAVTEMYEKHGDRNVLPGNLCSKVIDFCTSERERNEGAGYYWPPDFQVHRDRLREEERQGTQSDQHAAGARA